MALELELDSVEGLDDSVKSLYVENGDKFKLDVSGIEDTSGLKSALQHERDERKRAKDELKTLRGEIDSNNLKAAEEKGDFEQLHKSAMQENEKLKTQITERDVRDDKNMVNREAMRIAMKLADGYNAEILSKEIAERLSAHNGEVKVLDESGNLTVSSMNELEAIFKNNERFASLLKGNQSSGGGASGGSNGGGAAKEKTRSEFNDLNPVEASKFMKDGGKVTND